MSLLDDLGGKLGLGGSAASGDSRILQSILGLLGQGGGLTDLVRAFQERGLGDVIGSWVGRGANLPISVDQLTHGLGLERLRELAAQAGIPLATAAATLANALPGLIDQLTPDGKVPEGGLLEKGLGDPQGQAELIHARAGGGRPERTGERCVADSS